MVWVQVQVYANSKADKLKGQRHSRSHKQAKVQEVNKQVKLTIQTITKHTGPKPEQSTLNSEDFG